MSRIYKKNLPDGRRAGSTLVDLDGVQVMITLFEADGEYSAELAFRGRPSDPFSEPIRLSEDEQPRRSHG
jgi:hypothetical protein